jgi:hypothetical protein
MLLDYIVLGGDELSHRYLFLELMKCSRPSLVDNAKDGYRCFRLSPRRERPNCFEIFHLEHVTSDIIIGTRVLSSHSYPG